ncbi:hypothetical protein V1477_012318, partial [Vespula maculifrons]
MIASTSSLIDEKSEKKRWACLMFHTFISHVDIDSTTETLRIYEKKCRGLANDRTIKTNSRETSPTRTNDCITRAMFAKRAMLATKTILKWNKLDSENTESSTAKTPVRILAIFKSLIRNVEEEPPTTSQTDDYDEGGMTDTRGEAS